jgi:hypothetical protein
MNTKTKLLIVIIMASLMMSACSSSRSQSGNADTTAGTDGSSIIQPIDPVMISPPAMVAPGVSDQPQYSIVIPPTVIIVEPPMIHSSPVSESISGTPSYGSSEEPVTEGVPEEILELTKGIATRLPVVDSGNSDSETSSGSIREETTVDSDSDSSSVDSSVDSNVSSGSTAPNESAPPAIAEETNIELELSGSCKGKKKAAIVWHFENQKDKTFNSAHNCKNDEYKIKMKGEKSQMQSLVFQIALY